MNLSKQNADIIKLPANRRNRSVHVVKGLKRAVDAKLMYLFDGLCENAADALFEEQFGSSDSVALSRQFNITRALRLQSDTQLSEFKNQMGQSWVQLLNKKNTLLLNSDEGEHLELLKRYAERNRNHYKILLEELRQRFSVLVGTEVIQHPMLPLNFYQSFFVASACLDLTDEERLLLVSLFNRFVMDRFGQILAIVNQGLAEQGIHPPKDQPE